MSDKVSGRRGEELQWQQFVPWDSRAKAVRYGKVEYCNGVHSSEAQLNSREERGDFARGDFARGQFVRAAPLVYGWRQTLAAQCHMQYVVALVPGRCLYGKSW